MRPSPDPAGADAGQVALSRRSLLLAGAWAREHLAGRLNAEQNVFFGTKPYEEFYDLIGEPASGALPSVRRATQVDDEYLRDAGRYLVAVLEGTYQPGYETLDRPWFDKHLGPFIGHPTPGPTY